MEKQGQADFLEDALKGIEALMLLIQGLSKELESPKPKAQKVEAVTAEVNDTLNQLKDNILDKQNQVEDVQERIDASIQNIQAALQGTEIKSNQGQSRDSVRSSLTFNQRRFYDEVLIPSIDAQEKMRQEIQKAHPGENSWEQNERINAELKEIWPHKETTYEVIKAMTTLDYPGKEKDIGIVTQKMRNGTTVVENLERAAKQLDQYSWEELRFDKPLEVTKHLPSDVLLILDGRWLSERGLAHVNSNIDFIGRISINGQDQRRDYYYKNLSAFYAAQVELLHHGESITARQLLTMDAVGAADALGGRIAFNQSAGQILKDVEAGFAQGIDPQHGSREAINRFATQKHRPTAPSAIDKLEEDVNRGIGEVGEDVEAKAITGCDPDSDVINTPTAQDYKEIQDWGHEL